MGNRDKAQQLLDAVDELGKATEGRTFVPPAYAQFVNDSVASLLARAQVHAILALTDPTDEAGA